MLLNHTYLVMPITDGADIDKPAAAIDLENESVDMAIGPKSIGIVGGGIRGSIFARALMENDRSDLAAVCDPSEQTRERIAAEHGVPVYPGVEQMLDAHPELTAVVVATPDFAHRDAAVLCAERGLDLMIEKPLATDVDEAVQIAKAAEASGARIMVGFENRWNRRFEAARALVRSPESGPVLCQIINLNDTLHVPTKMLSWAARSSPAWFLMPHTLDLAIWISGAKPVSVYARGIRSVLVGIGVDTWDSVTATFTMDDRSYVVLNSSWILPESAPAVFDFRYEIQSANSAMHIDGTTHGIRHLTPNANTLPQLGLGDRNGRLDGIPVDMVNTFVDYLHGNRDEVPTAQDGLLVTKAIAAVHESLETDQPVTIAL
jgi:predicted dehydrogenase